MFRVTLVNVASKGGVTTEYVKSGILNEEMRWRTQGTTSYSEALVAKNRGRSRNISDGRNNKGRSRHKSRSEEPFSCRPTWDLI